MSYNDWVPGSGCFDALTRPQGSGASQNWAGSSYSGFSDAPGQATTPSAPTGVAATSGANVSSVITWTDGSDGGSAVTSYNIVSIPATTTQHGSSGMTFTGLTNGTSYTFKVTAVNAVGTGAQSAASAAATPYTVPGAPTGVAATSGANVSSVITWTPPASTGGSAITSYKVDSTPATTQQTLASGGTFTGLTNGTSYTFKVTAVNAAGSGSQSAASAAAVPYTVPGAPTIGTAVAGDTTATVSWTAPVSNGGSAITGYLVSSSPATTTQALASGGTFTGLTNGVAYTFTVVATNAAGNSAASSASNSVSPAASLPSNVGIQNTTMTAWDQSQAVTAAQNFTAPDGSNGYTLTAANSGDYHVIYQNNAGYSGNSLTTPCKKYGIVAKKGTQNYLGINVYNGFAANFDLNLGVVGTTTGAGTTSSITSLGGGWYYCELVLAVAQRNPLLLSVANTLANALANYPSSQVVGGWSGNVQVYHPVAY